MNQHPIMAIVAAPLLVALAAHAGGELSVTAAPASAQSSAATEGAQLSALAESERIAAARVTADSTTNACFAIRPFYWEVGDGSARRVSGSPMAAGSSVRYTANLPINIASASKWIYGTYVAQVTNGELSSEDHRYLSLLSGYISFVGCSPRQTVGSCMAADINDRYTETADGKFSYGDGHMQKHATLNGLAAMNVKALATAVRGQIGTDVALNYGFPQVASGLFMSPDNYARVLRKMLNGSLRMASLLGTAPVCTNPLTCGLKLAIYTPVPTSESWTYSVAHWVESDPVVGDGAFSSPGGLGFYPWIDASKTYYGVVSRIVAEDGAYASAQCGRLIRQAWLTGIAR
jgi:hypothetical protein